MPLELQACTPSDVPRITQVIFDAFATDAINLAMFPREHTQEILPWYHRRQERIMKDPSIRAVKVVDTDIPSTGSGEEIIGYGRWQVPVHFDIAGSKGIDKGNANGINGEESTATATSTSQTTTTITTTTTATATATAPAPEEQPQTESESQSQSQSTPPPPQQQKDNPDTKSFIEPASNPLPPHANAKLFADYLKKFAEYQSKYIRDDQDFICQMLAVDPKHQGRGAGAMMIQYGVDGARQAALAVEEADKQQAGRSGSIPASRKPVAWLEAAEGAYSLYVKFGFKDVERVLTNLQDYGVENGKMYTSVCMWHTF
jgi:GNAT superfamily N-acetyltransferase